MLKSPFYKVANFQASNCNKKKLLQYCFSVKFEKFLRIPILKNIWTTTSVYWLLDHKLVFAGVCAPWLSALILGPRLPSRWPSVPKISQEQIYEQSILLIQGYTYSTFKYTYSRCSKSYLEKPSYGVQNKWKGF